MAIRNSRLRKKIRRQRRQSWFRTARLENLEERRLLAYVPLALEQGVFVEQGAAASSGGQAANAVAGPVVTVTTPLANTNILETGGTTTITATLDQVSTESVTVTLLASADGGEANYNADYELSDGLQIVIPAGQLSQTETISALSDELDETDEPFTLTVDSVTGATLSGASEFTYQILDDDEQPVVTLSPVDQSIDEAAGVATITATLDAVSARDVTVFIEVRNAPLEPSSTATLTDDYTTSELRIDIAAGDLTGSATVTAVQDAIDEADETVVLGITSADNATFDATAVSNVTITDDDEAPLVTLVSDKTEINESDGPVVLTATLSAVSSKDVTIELLIRGTANNLLDYTTASSTIFIPAGQPTGTLVFDIVEDDIFEVDETIVTTITSLGNATAATTEPVTITLLNDDAAPEVFLSQNPLSITEGGSAVVTAFLSTRSDLPVTLSFVTTGTATELTDWTANRKTITIQPGITSGNLTISASDDFFDEPIETVVVTLDSVSNGTFVGNDFVNIEILDDDDPPAVSIQFENSAITENNGTTDLIVSLSQPSGFDVTVNLDVQADGMGVAPFYTGLSQQIIIPAGQQTARTTITAIDDTLDENNTVIDVSIASLLQAVPGSFTTASLVIVDDDATPNVTLSVDQPTIPEANGTAVVTAELSAASLFDVTIDLGVSGSAAATDYGINATQITIPAGQTTGAVTIDSVDDGIFEIDETVIVDVIGVTNAVEASPQQITTTIVNDDSAPSVLLSIANPNLIEQTGSTTITATLSEVSSLDVTVTLAVAGTASATDFNPITTTILIRAGQSSGSVQLSTIDDAVDEFDETVIVSIDTVAGGTENGAQSVTANIIDDDDPPTILVSFDTASIDEADQSAVLTASLSGVSSQDVTATILISGTALLDTDFASSSIVGSAPNSTIDVIIPAGSLTATFDFNSIEDAIDENDETVIATVQSVTNALMGSTQSATLTITDNDPQPTVTLLLDPTSIDEAGGTATYTATLSEASSLDVTIVPSIQTTSSASDYALSAPQIVILAGDTSGTMMITAIEDSLYEPDEVLTISPDQIRNAVAASSEEMTLTILDDDPFPTLSIAATSANVVEGTTNQITASLDAEAGVDMTVDLILGGTASEGFDYAVPTKQITIPAGSTSASIEIATIDDAIDEIEQSVTIDATATDGVMTGEQASTSFVIGDNDSPPVANVNSTFFVINEVDGQALLEVRLSQLSERDITFSLIPSGANTEGVDYTLSQPTITIPAGTLVGSVQIDSVDDDVFEGDEVGSIQVTADDADTVTFKNQPIRLTIVDNETEPTLTLSVDNASISETNGVSTLTATLSGPAQSEIVVNLAFAGQGDTTSDDFSTSSNQIVIPSGQLSGSLVLTATDDTFVEQDGLVNVNVTSFTGNLTVNPEQLSIAIQDDDDGQLVVTSTSTPVIVNERGTTAELQVRLSAAPQSDVVVEVDSDDTGEVVVTPTVIRFTSANWDTPQTVTATGQADLFADANVAADISFSVREADSDPGFAGLGSTVIEVINQNVNFNHLTVSVQADQLVVSDTSSGQVIDSRPVNSTDRLRIDLGGGAKTLTVGDLGRLRNIIDIDAQNDDTVNFGDGWTADIPQFIVGVFTHVLRRDDAVLHLHNQKPNTNPYNRHDTNRDGIVTASDSLVIINGLGEGLGGPISDPQPNDPPRLFYMDVSGDAVISPLDAVMVINKINKLAISNGELVPPATSGEQLILSMTSTAEGEATMGDVVSRLAIEHPATLRSANTLFDFTTRSASIDRAILDWQSNEEADEEESLESLLELFG